MGNLADKRRLREQAGELIHKGGVNITSKDEMMFIPFIQSGNPDEERPWLYKGYYSMPDGNIGMDCKRMKGNVEITISCAEKHKEYISVAVGEFISKVYKESPHEAKSISIEEHDTETDILKKEIMRLQIDAENAKKVVDKFKEISKSL
tara:strand:+ start:230 stop:676 length:447 start_codon:yes stop_codon:yes gene_type:complete